MGLWLSGSAKKEKAEDYEVLINELKSYDESMLKKPRIICFTKIDAIDEKQRKDLDKVKFSNLKKDIPVIKISAVSGENIQQLLDEIWEKLSRKIKVG